MTTGHRKPSVGEMVHFVAHDDSMTEHVHRAAIVTEVPGDGRYVGLCVVNPNGLSFFGYVLYDGRITPRSGTWHFPEEAA